MAKPSLRWKGPVNYAISFLDNPDTVDSYHVQNLKPFYGCIKSSSEEGHM